MKPRPRALRNMQAFYMIHAAYGDDVTRAPTYADSDQH